MHRNLIARLFAAVGLCLVATPAWAGADQLAIGPVPDWVQPSAYRDAPNIDDNTPVRLLGSDIQVRLVRGETRKFVHMTFRIATPNGLSAGNLSIAWSPDRAALTVHKVLIHRGDQTIDVLGAGQTFTVVRREQNLEMAMLDGVLTANLQPEGLQVGDIVEYSYTTAYHDPVMKGHVEDLSAAWNALPVARMHFRASWPTDLAVRLQSSGALPPIKPVRVGTDMVADVAIDDLNPGVPPRNAPLRYRLGRVIELSDFAGWDEVSGLMAPLYVTASQLPASGPLHDELEKIRSAATTPLDRAQAALKLVQDRVRYVALEMGAGGYVPSEAASTWSRRFGDCKAKTALLLGLLHALGVAAEPVLVNASLGDGIDTRLPMAGLFNHVLVRATIDGKTYWLDGTRTGRHRMRPDEPPAFVWGLPLIAGHGALVRMMPPPLAEPLEALRVHLDASAGLQGTVPVDAEIVLTGDAGFATNASLGNLAGDARREALERLWKDRVRRVEVTSSTTHYDAEAEELHIVMTGTVRMDWAKNEYRVELAEFPFQNVDFSRTPGPESDVPYAVSYPFFARAAETITLPRTGGAFHIGTAMDVNETVAGMALQRHASLNDGVFSIDISERSVTSEFPASDAAGAQARLRALAVQTPLLHMPLAYRSTTQDIATVRADTPTTSAEYVNRAVVFMKKSMLAEARGDLDRAIELDANDAFAWADRALIKVQARDFDGARADLARAEAINPNLGLIYKVKGELAVELRDWPVAARALEQAYALEPSDELMPRQLAGINAQLGNFDKALGYADKVVRNGGADRQMTMLRLGLLEKLGRNAELVEALTQMLRSEPGNAQLLRARAGAYLRLGKRDLAIRDIQKLGPAARRAPEATAPPIDVTAPVGKAHPPVPIAM